ELPRHPHYNLLTGKGSASYGRTRLLDVLERYELWPEAIQLSAAGYLEPLEDRAADARRVQVLGAAYFYAGDRTRGREQVAGLEAMIAAVKKMAAAKEAEKKAAAGGKQANKTEKTAGKGPRAGSGKARAKKLKTLEQSLACLRGHEALAAGDAQAAVGHFEHGQTKDKELLSRAYLAAGNGAKAEELARAALDAGKNEFCPLANYVDILWRLDRKVEAGKQFEQLRTLGWQADLDLPICARLQPVAAERGITGNWRIAPPTAEDIGQRPQLAKLGPFRWRPPMAPAWQAKDAGGKLVSSTQYRGRPVLVVFYLGFGCIHCVEQLKAFSPLADKFEQAGIQIVAIGTDSVEDLADSSAADKAGAKAKPVPPFAFPLLSDAGLDMFHRFRAYDDFEKQPLHGVFLIDTAGRMRWQDISYEPFTDAAFVLKEAQRLLSRGDAQSAIGRSPDRAGK
ncbi:MAG TPA: peroxiredoxin family protein, partial [Pirellulales bacterium]